MKNLVSHQLVNYLEKRGVEHIFGLCGHTNIAVLSALEKSSIQFINVRHEQIASHAADGSKLTMPMTVVTVIHCGPPICNSLSIANRAAEPEAAETNAENAGCADS